MSDITTLYHKLDVRTEQHSILRCGRCKNTFEVIFHCGKDPDWDECEPEMRFSQRLVKWCPFCGRRVQEVIDDD